MIGNLIKSSQIFHFSVIKILSIVKLATKDCDFKKSKLIILMCHKISHFTRIIIYRNSIDKPCFPSSKSLQEGFLPFQHVLIFT